jgi:osmotically inducible protein OsmC
MPAEVGVGSWSIARSSLADFYSLSAPSGVTIKQALNAGKKKKFCHYLSEASASSQDIRKGETNMKRTASAVWNGSLKEGNGQISSQSGVLTDTPYSFGTRFAEERGTNPEELIAAAHAGCFSMALSAGLGKAGFEPARIRTSASLDLENVEGSWRITTIRLETVARVPKITSAQFENIAQDAKTNCPVSQVLRANITLVASLED